MGGFSTEAIEASLQRQWRLVYRGNGSFSTEAMEASLKKQWRLLYRGHGCFFAEATEASLQTCGALFDIAKWAPASASDSGKRDREDRNGTPPDQKSSKKCAREGGRGW